MKHLCTGILWLLKNLNPEHNRAVGCISLISVLVSLIGLCPPLQCAASRGHQCYQRGHPAVPGPARPKSRWISSWKDKGNPSPFFSPDLLYQLKNCRGYFWCVLHFLCTYPWYESHSLKKMWGFYIVSTDFFSFFFKQLNTRKTVTGQGHYGWGVGINSLKNPL